MRWLWEEEKKYRYGLCQYILVIVLLKIYYRGRFRGMGNDAEGEEGNTDDN